MKKLLTSIAVALLSFSAFAQSNTIEFMGIPMDGTLEQMSEQMKARGYLYNKYYDNFYGDFYGDAKVNLVTNGNKVWMISATENFALSATDVKTKFNKLCKIFDKDTQFQAADKGGYTIADNEDVGVEMSNNNKTYKATYYLKTGDQTVDEACRVWYIIIKDFGEYRVKAYFENGHNK